MYLGCCQLSETEAIVGVGETSSAWCPLECHLYLSKPDGVGSFRSAQPFDGHYALITH